jgi:hypothetical protein
MHHADTGIKILKIVIILALIGAITPVANAVFDDYTPCCPAYADYPDYYYPVDPYYTFPTYCFCPFLDDMLARWEKWDIPDSYWEWVIESGSSTSSCSTCSGSSSTYTSISYSNANLIVPEKDTLMEVYKRTTVTTTVKSKDQALANI